jgi:hypothetical protein
LYAVAGLSTGVYTWWTLMWGIWGAPTFSTQVVALAGSIVLLISAFLNLYSRHAAAIAASLSCVAAWSFWGPAWLVTLAQGRLSHLASYSFATGALLFIATIHAWRTTLRWAIRVR